MMNIIEDISSATSSAAADSLKTAKMEKENCLERNLTFQNNDDKDNNDVSQSLTLTDRGGCIRLFFFLR